jgi:hypothetical protein
MSSGGRRGIDVSGITPLRLQNASDVVTRTTLRLTYQNFASTVGANAYANRTPNSYGNFLTFTQGRKEQYNDVSATLDCSACAGLPYAYRNTMSFRT